MQHYGGLMKFSATLDLHGKTATGIKVPESVIEKLGGGKRPAIIVTLKRHTFRTTIGVMGGLYLIPVSAEIRKAAGVSAGDSLSITIDLDTEKRETELPDDLAAAMRKSKPALAFFEGLAPSHKKEWVRWVTEAKKPETRAARIEKTVASLTEGNKTR
jgi:bifunctional DNA-binding transcriptional regulator/antitoxin component of YhaV-PrlF toxin-antitoxin module